MREIEAFLAVAEELHFGRAALRLHVSTGSISQTIRTLERRVGAPLFERTSRQVRLTSVGAEFLARLRPAHEQLTEALREAQRATRLRYRDPLRAGFSSTLPPEVPSRLIKAFTDQAPDSQLIRFDHPASDFLRWFEAGQFDVDVYVGWAPHQDIEPRPLPDWVATGAVLFLAPRAAIVGTRHPLASRQVIDAEELAAYDVLRPWGFPPYAEAWAPSRTPAGRPIPRVQQTRITYAEDLPDLLRDGTLVHLSIAAAARTLAVHPDLVAVSVTGLPPFVCTTMWANANENQWIDTFVAAATAEYADAGLDLEEPGRS
jgi:DNA-binding transcriptional LysR family regulator